MIIGISLPHIPRRLIQLIAVATALRMVLTLALEFGNDEAYYFLYALDLQWNYFDHPPGIAWLIRLSTLNLLLTDEFFVRLGAIACSAMGTVLVYRLGTVLKNEQTGWYAAILYTANLYTSLIAGTFITPDSPQIVAARCAAGHARYLHYTRLRSCSPAELGSFRLARRPGHPL
jgi:4-amino-4-deoxy-L-arabinose transferase-like glycosyltransferase